MKRNGYIITLFVLLAVSLAFIFASCSSRDHGSSTGSSAVYVTNNTSTTNTGIGNTTTGGSDLSGGNTGTGGGTGTDGGSGTDGGTGGGTNTNTSIGLSLYSQVTATITNIQIINTETGLGCTLVNAPIIPNLAGIENIMQLVGTADCPPGPYNRIQIQFDRSVELLSGPTGTPTACLFDSYKDTGSSNQPNMLHCDDKICTLSINGAVNVFANQRNKIGLDFHLKDFIVSNPGGSNCSVTMKVSPLNASDIKKLGHPEAVTGIISGLSTTNGTFDLTRGSKTFSVLYSGISTTNQPGLDELLERAQNDRLRVRVMSLDIDFMGDSIAASDIIVKVEGPVSGLTGSTFSLSYGPEGANQMTVDYSNAAVEGSLADGAWYEVKLYGYSDPTDEFLARKVEAESPGFLTEN